MSMRYKGGVISATAPITSASVAPGIWTLEQQLQAIAGSGWPRPSVGWISLLTTNIIARNPAVDSAGNVYIVGYDNTSPYGNQTIKFDQYGAITWQRRLATASGFTSGTALSIDASGNVYNVGTTNNGSSGDYMQVIKYDSSGNTSYQRFVGSTTGTYPGNLLGVIYDAGTSSIFLVGKGIYNTGTSATANFLFKMSAAGSLSSQVALTATTGGVTRSEGYADVVLDSSGNLYACGTVASTTAFFTYAALTKYNSSFAVQWQRGWYTTGGGLSARAGTVGIDSSNNLYVAALAATGSSNSVGIIKYDSSGTYQWSRYLQGPSSGPGPGQTNAIAVDSSGNVFVCSEQYDSTGEYCQIARYDNTGAIQWQRSLRGSSATHGSGIKIDGSNNLYVTAYLTNGTGSFLCKLPTDGSGTGTYTVGAQTVTYAASSATDGAWTVTSYTPTETIGSYSWVDGATTNTISSTSFTSTVTPVS